MNGKRCSIMIGMPAFVRVGENYLGPYFVDQVGDVEYELE